MKAKLSGVALGVSAVALVVAMLGSIFTIMRARQMDAGAPAPQLDASLQSDLLRSTEVIRVRVEDLERKNTELRKALTAAQTRLKNVESVYESSEGGMESVNDRIAKLEKSSAETGRAMFRFGTTLSATRRTLGLTDGEAEVETLEEEEESEEEPKLEDFISIDMNPINGLPGPHIIIEGANLHIRSGSGATDDFGRVLYGLGNVVVGYNEYDPTQLRARNGSHNLIVGSGHGFSSFAGLLAGYANEVNAPSSSVSGGSGNAANGWASSISGGLRNLADGDSSSVTGGTGNQTFAKYGAIVGGMNNTVNIEGHSQMGTLNIPPTLEP